jgi:hypothetical protein
MFRAFITAFFMLAAASAASAQTWEGPNPDRTPRAFGQGDVDFVLAELCFPFLLQEANGDALARERNLETAFGTQDWAGGDRAYLVGQADVMVAFDEARDGRACTLIIRSGNPERYRAAIATRMASWPVTLTPSAGEPQRGGFSSRTLLCSPPEGPHDIAMISIGGANGTPPVLMTIARLAERNDSCGAPPTPR